MYGQNTAASTLESIDSNPEECVDRYLSVTMVNTHATTAAGTNVGDFEWLTLGMADAAEMFKKPETPYTVVAPTGAAAAMSVAASVAVAVAMSLY